ncbi:hypothetical protein E2C01_088971 [Portunus trituberculatus]|uniref:Uncharacterized protein n=1 Tax=Portunus trituberculatus TaxID=210409 RepID=A0A5B7JHV4_PORTR|nr:hypothetical protein [Portunus trituberculatus]
MSISCRCLFTSAQVSKQSLKYEKVCCYLANSCNPSNPTQALSFSTSRSFIHTSPLLPLLVPPLSPSSIFLGQSYGAVTHAYLQTLIHIDELLSDLRDLGDNTRHLSVGHRLLPTPAPHSVWTTRLTLTYDTHSLSHAFPPHPIAYTVCCTCPEGLHILSGSSI